MKFDLAGLSDIIKMLIDRRSGLSRNRFMLPNPGDTLECSENQILLAARMVREYYYPNRKNNIPDWILVFAIRDLLTLLPETETTPENLFDLLITQSRIKKHLSRYTAASITSQARNERSNNANSAEVSVFTGTRTFSLVTISGMVAYLTSRGQKICKTRLNKLLFYSDFVHYFLHGRSISGAKYVRDRSGPVLYRHESVFKTMEFTGVLQTNWDGKGNELIARDESLIGTLTLLEIVTMHWVFSHFGSMAAAELNQYSYSESAYRFSRQGDYIAYEYAKLLQTLPDKYA